jgi:hypothetical protein
MSTMPRLKALSSGLTPHAAIIAWTFSAPIGSPRIFISPKLLVTTGVTLSCLRTARLVTLRVWCLPSLAQAMGQPGSPMTVCIVELPGSKRRTTPRPVNLSKQETAGRVSLVGNLSSPNRVLMSFCKTRIRDRFSSQYRICSIVPNKGPFAKWNVGGYLSSSCYGARTCVIESG